MQRLKSMLLRPPGILSGGLFFPLTLASHLYGFACRLRAGSYRVGIFPSSRLPCRVISIGNLTVGGTGKTPMVIHLADYLSRSGRKVGVVSRGYGGKTNASELLVSDGERLLVTPKQVGEEPYLIAQRLSSVPVIVGKRRAGAGRILCERFGVDTLLLDDGFQHLSLYRDVNLLLIDITDPFGNGFLLPRGILREPFSALGRADAILLTRIEQNGYAESDRIKALLEEISRRYTLPILRSSFSPSLLVPLTESPAQGIEWIRQKRWYLFSGIGNPQAFRRSVELLGGKIVGEKIYSDHCDYSHRMVKSLFQDITRTSPDGVITTEKDGVKVRPHLPTGLPVFALRIEVGEIEEKAVFDKLVLGTERPLGTEK